MRAPGECRSRPHSKFDLPLGGPRTSSVAASRSVGFTDSRQMPCQEWHCRHDRPFLGRHFLRWGQAVAQLGQLGTLFGRISAPGSTFRRCWGPPQKQRHNSARALRHTAPSEFQERRPRKSPDHRTNFGQTEPSPVEVVKIWSLAQADTWPQTRQPWSNASQLWLRPPRNWPTRTKFGRHPKFARTGLNFGRSPRKVVETTPNLRAWARHPPTGSGVGVGVQGPFVPPAPYKETPPTHHACPRRGRKTLRALRCCHSPGPGDPGPHLAGRFRSGRAPSRGFLHSTRPHRKRRRRPKWQTVARAAARLVGATPNRLAPTPKHGDRPSLSKFPARNRSGRLCPGEVRPPPQSPSMGMTVTETHSGSVILVDGRTRSESGRNRPHSGRV